MDGIHSSKFTSGIFSGDVINKGFKTDMLHDPMIVIIIISFFMQYGCSSTKPH